MNRAERRKQKAIWRRDMRHMAKEAAGVWSVEIVRPHRLPSVPDIAIVVARYLAVLRAGPAEPPLCMLCDHTFAWPAPVPLAFVCMRPHRDKPAIASLSGVCGACSNATDDELYGRAIAYVRKSFLPDARRLDPAHLHMAEAGRA